MKQDTATVIDFSDFMSASHQPARRFLFLQGPHGSFFAKLARTLTSKGHKAHRIHLNGGDKGDWMQGQGLSYTGTPGEWKSYLAEYLFRHEITDIVFYGYWRSHHRVAAELAEQLDIRIHGFEEGLLRPHWVTLDPRLPCAQSADINAAMTGKKEIISPYPAMPSQKSVISEAPLSWMVHNCIRYYLNYFRHRRLFKNYRTHRLVMAGEESKAWIKQFFTLPKRKWVAKRRMKKVLQETSPFFIFCLQLDGDSQILKYSDFSAMQDVMEQVLESFATHAPPGTKLVVKNHPLDNGIGKLEKKCRRIARKYGIADRVTFLNFGKLAGLVKKTEGMVAVNSSAGLQALYHGTPVKTLGHAVYNIDGLADPQPLDGFWINPAVPSADVYQKLQDILAATSQHPGNFYDPACHDALIGSCLRVVLADNGKEAAVHAGAAQQSVINS